MTRLPIKTRTLALIGAMVVSALATAVPAQQPAASDQDAFKKAQAESNKVPNTPGGVVRLTS